MKALDRFLGGCDVAVGRTLLVGNKIHEGTSKSDRRELYRDAVGVDMEDGLGVDRVLDLEEALPDDFGQFAHVECTSVLEHSRRPWLLAANIERAMAHGSTVVVLVPWVWRRHSYPNDYWRMTPAGVVSLFPSIVWERQQYIVEGRLLDEVPKLTFAETRWHARSELIMFGRKCSSTS